MRSGVRLNMCVCSKMLLLPSKANCEVHWGPDRQRRTRCWTDGSPIWVKKWNCLTKNPDEWRKSKFEIRYYGIFNKKTKLIYGTKRVFLKTNIPGSWILTNNNFKSLGNAQTLFVVCLQSERVSANAVFVNRSKERNSKNDFFSMNIVKFAKKRRRVKSQTGKVFLKLKERKFND